MVKDDLKDPFEAIPAVLQLPTNGDPLDRFQTSMYLLVTSTPVYVHISWGIFFAVQSSINLMMWRSKYTSNFKKL